MIIGLIPVAIVGIIVAIWGLYWAKRERRSGEGGIENEMMARADHPSDF